MPRLDLSRWFRRLGNPNVTPDEGDVATVDARVREAFNLSRWFAGIGDTTAKAGTPPDAATAESDARVRMALDTLPVTLFEFDPKGIYTSVGGRYVGLFGITPAQIVGRSVFDFPRLVPGKNMMVRRALLGEAVAFTGIWPLGRFMIRLQPRFDAAGQLEAVVGLGFGLERSGASDKQIHQLLEALRQSEARFRAMCEQAPLGIYVSNSKHEIGFANPALCTLLGREPAELLGRQLHAVVHDDDRVGLPAVHDASKRGAVAYADVLRLVRKDGTTVLTSLRVAEMRDGSEVLGYVGAVADITREHEALLRIDRVQQDLHRVIESSPEGIAIVRDGRFIFVNRALLEALGYQRPQELLHRQAGEMVHPDDRARALALIAEPHASSDDGSVHELRYRRASGDYALMEIRPATLAEFEGAPALLLSARDITERKRLQTQLVVTERLLSVGTLAAGVAHEINNPLAAVLSNLEWVTGRLARLQESMPDSGVATRAELERFDRPLAEAREAAGRVRAIVRDLKLLSRAEEDLQRPIELTPVLDTAARMAWNEVRHRARFVREYGELPRVHGSEARLGQVFLNLIINAAQAIPEGRADEHEIRLSAHVPAGNHVVVEVRDTGYGIAPDIVNRIFDPFFTTKPAGVGTGLGLSICHRIVTSMGGRIEVESQLGRGSMFRVTLDRVQLETRPAPQPPAPAVPHATTRGRVLVIDDEPSMGNAIKLVLGEDEHHVDVFTSARRALARLRAGERYDAIVCDVMMPEMTGADFHSALASLRPELANQIIFLTGGAFTLRAREFLDRVPNPRLDKPFDADNLRALVNRQLSR